MSVARIGLGLLLWTIGATAQQYVISTYVGGAPPPTPSPAVSGSIGFPISIATDGVGNAYFASSDLNCVFKLDSAGVLTRVAGSSARGYSGDGGPAISARLDLFFGNAAAVWGGLAVDRTGNLFIADVGNHRIRRVSPDGIITTVAGNGSKGFSGDGGPANSAQLNWPWGVALDGAGNLFILDTYNYRVRKVARSGIITTVAGGGTLIGSSSEGGPATSALVAPWSVAADAAGNLFISDFYYGWYSGSGNQAVNPSIRKVSPDGIITTVSRTQAWAVAVDGTGNLLVADGVKRVSRISADGIATTIAGGDAVGFAGDNGPATNAQLSAPSGVGVDGAGNIFIADRFNSRIRKVSKNGVIVTVAGDGTRGPKDGGPATNSQLLSPYGVAADAAGNLFIADAANNRIRKVSPGGTIVTVAGNGTPGFSGDGGPAIDAQLGYPIDLTLDSAGNLFVLDAGNNRVRKISTSGTISTVAGNGTAGFSGDDGPATAAAIGSSDCNRYCGGLAVDAAGNLFLAVNDRIRRVSPTGIITTVAGDGAPGRGAMGIAMDAGGNLFIAEYGGIRKLSPDGVITTVAGGGTKAGSSADGGPATSAQLSHPYGLAVDGAGALFFTDPGDEFFAPGEAGLTSADNRIRRVSPNGIISTVAGNGARNFTGDGGPASTATLDGPTGLAVDHAGNLYVADNYNRVVRILRPTDRSVVVGSVVSAASQRDEAVSPGEIVVITGDGLGPSELTQNQPVNGRFGTELAGTKVSFNGIAAPVLYTSATRVSAIVPYAVTGTTAEVRVSYQAADSASFAVPLATAAPSLFTLNQAGWGQAAALNVVDSTWNTATNPVKIGSYLSLYATGEGQTAPSAGDGSVGGSTAAHPVLPVTVTIGGIPATVQYAGSALGQVAGLMQVNVQVPNGVEAGGYVPVVLQVGEKSSSTAVWIAVAN